MSISAKQIEEAYYRTRSELIETPLIPSAFKTALSGNEIFLKLENAQLSGSFKIRGVTNAFATIPDFQKATIVAASTGNHAAAVLHRCKQHKVYSILFVPKNISKPKLAAMKDATSIKMVGEHCGETEILAKAWADERNLAFIHPYNDAQVIIGQGTLAPELENQIDLNTVGAILMPVGGGGLISGVGTYIKTRNPDIEIIGCQPKMAPEMYDSLRAGEVVKPYEKSTISDATAGGLDPDSITFPICQSVVDNIVLIEEDEIEKAVYNLYTQHNILVEPSAALAYAAALKTNFPDKNKSIIVIITGGKISIDLFERIKAKYEDKDAFKYS